MNIPNYENLKCPFKDLPKIGERVKVICIKEMIYLGNENDHNGDWMDDGKGDRGIMFWEEI